MHKDHILNELGPNKVPPKWYAVKIDESNGCEPEFLKRCGGKCYQIYLVDMSTRTHLCEFTPSYCLLPVELVAEEYPEDDDTREELYEELRNVFYDCCNEISYMHIHDVERFSDDCKEDLGLTFRDDEWGDNNRGEETAMEAYQGDPIW